MSKTMKKMAAVTVASAMLLGNTTCAWAAEAADDNCGYQVELTASETGKMLLQEMAGVDLSWLNCIDLNIKADESNPDAAAVKMSIGVNDSELVSVYSYVPAGSTTAYVQIPELSEEFLALNVADLLANVTVNGQPMSLETLEAGEAFDFDAVLESLFTLATPYLQILQPVEDTVWTTEYQGQTVEIPVSGVGATMSDVVGATKEVLTSLKENPELLNVLNTVSNPGISEADLDEMIASMEEQENSEELNGGSINLLFGATEDAVMGGCAQLANANGDTMELAKFVATAEDTSMVGSAEIGTEGSVVGADFTVDQEAGYYASMLKMNEENLLYCEAQMGDGYASFYLAPQIEELQGFALDINAVEDFMDIAIVMNDEKLVDLSVMKSEPEAIDVPDLTGVNAYNMTDEEAVSTYASGIDMMALFQKLNDAGLLEALTGTGAEAEAESEVQ